MYMQTCINIPSTLVSFLKKNRIFYADEDFPLLAEISAKNFFLDGFPNRADKNRNIRKESYDACCPMCSEMTIIKPV